jgi:hypothetical protein
MKVNSSLILVLWMTSIFTLIPSVFSDPFIDQIVSVNYGQYAGYGQDQLPEIVLGPPHGAGDSAGSTHVLSLGDGGSITLAFTDNTVIDEPGVDFIVFENAFFSGGDPTNLFCEPAFVEVSQDGIEYRRFSNNYDPEGTPPNNPANWSGFAGLKPVLSNPENEIDPTDPETAGGDSFDLTQVGFEWIRYIRLLDTGEPPDAETDDDGDEIYDPAGPTFEKSGFDLDAIAAVHSIEEPTPTSPSPTPNATATPVSSPTQIPSSSPTPTPTTTSIPDDFDFQMSITQSVFRPGDRFTLIMTVSNGFEFPISCQCYIVLDACGVYYFWPDWELVVTSKMTDFPTGFSEEIILDFDWPAVESTSTSFGFWGAVVDDSGSLMDDVQHLPFSYTF